MKLLKLLLCSSLLLVSCAEYHNDFFPCAKEKGLFSSKQTIPISLDTIKTYRAFQDYAKHVRGSMSGCSLMFGFVYNFKDSCFKPNKKDQYNVTIASMDIFARFCCIHFADPSLKIYLTQLDSITINDSLNHTSYALKYNKDIVRGKIDAYYDRLFSRLLKNEYDGNGYMYVVVSDFIPFKKCLLPTLRVILNSYTIHFTNYLKLKYKTTICSLNTEDLSKRGENLNFNLIIDNNDDRNGRVFFMPPK